MDLPYLTSDQPGIGGRIKQRPEDFVVHEIPAYEPAGQGEHVYCEIQKTGLSTFDAINRIARALRVSPREIGYAGLKDTQAVTRQTLSICGTTEEQVAALQIPGIQFLWAIRHANKLRIGHLKGNRFVIKIRDVEPTAIVRAKVILQRIASQGFPNYFGEQRFGRRGNNHLIGAALVRGDDAEVLRLLIGDPQKQRDDAQEMGARKAFEQGRLDESMRLFPRRCGMERRLLARLIKTAKPTAAVRSIDEKLRKLFISAVQSQIFNQVVARRINSLATLCEGELAWKHDSGAVFQVEHPASEQARCDAFEISPSGPLIGYRMTLPTGAALALEQAEWELAGLNPEDFRRTDFLKIKGARRPLRVQAGDMDSLGGVDEFGPHITVGFTLPPGAYATVLLRELTKSDAADEISEPDAR